MGTGDDGKVTVTNITHVDSREKNPLWGMRDENDVKLGTYHYIRTLANGPPHSDHEHF